MGIHETAMMFAFTFNHAAEKQLKKEALKGTTHTNTKK